MDSLLQQLQKQHSALLCQQEAFTAGGMMDKEVKQFLQTAVSHPDKQVTKSENRMEVVIQEHQGQMADNITTITGHLEEDSHRSDGAERLFSKVQQL